MLIFIYCNTVVTMPPCSMYTCLVCRLERWVRPSFDEYEDMPGKLYPRERQQCSGCPAALLGNVSFPSATSWPIGTFDKQDSEHLNINMMPFVCKDISTLPSYCQQYWPLIKTCLSFAPKNSSANLVGYLTIDERPVKAGNSQRYRK